MPELIQAFLKEAPGLIAQHKQAMVSGDAQIFRRAAHSIKSNAAAFGAIRLVETARELESLARDDRMTEISEPLQRLEQAYRSAAETLEDLCN